MNHPVSRFLCLLLLSSAGLADAEVKASGDCASPRVEFAIGEIEQTCARLKEPVEVRFVEEPALGPQAYRIDVAAPGRFTITGGDAAGLMYGGLRLAEAIRLGRGIGAVKPETAKPYLLQRGLKMNIPLDVRTPSYDDTGDSAKWNIETVWDLSFWQEYLDTMARHRYNVLTLWNRHPFPSLVTVPEFPDVALDDVCSTTFHDPKDNHPQVVPDGVWNNLVVLKKTTIAEKIDFWRTVMAYAKDRGIEVYWITWNIFLDGAYGKNGVTDDKDNPQTVAYLRASVRELVKTYPDLAGIGLTAGERMNKFFKGSKAKEEWLWKTYGLGVADALKESPGRQVRFIHRDWQTSVPLIKETFAGYPGPLDTSFKYAKARIHSTPTPVFADEILPDLREHGMKCWWNLRNDDLFCLRWGDPDYVRAFIRNIPLDVTAGIYMGSDGYVWARNFALKDPALRGQMELDRHWYAFMLWGRMAYDPGLDPRIVSDALRDRYPETDPDLLRQTWAVASGIMPQINRAYFQAGDFRFSPEGSFAKSGFLTVDHFIKGEAMPGTKEISIADFLAMEAPADPEEKVTPLQAAENLRTLAENTLAGCKQLRETTPAPSTELSGLITDLEAMAWMGRYYAGKITGATRLAQFRKTGDATRKQEAVAALEEALECWKQYGRLAGSQYRPQELARGIVLDWDALAKEIAKDIAIAQSAKPDRR